MIIGITYGRSDDHFFTSEEELKLWIQLTGQVYKEVLRE